MIYKRFEELLMRRQEHPGETPSMAFKLGLGTMKIGFSTILRAIEPTYQRRYPGESTDEQTLVEIFSNSYPLVEQLSKGRLDSSHILMNLLSSDRALPGMAPLPECFELEETRNGLGLTLSAYVIRRFQEQVKTHPELFDRNGEPTIGCPAAVNFGEGSAIRKLFDWQKEILEKVFIGN